MYTTATHPNSRTAEGTRVAVTAVLLTLEVAEAAGATMAAASSSSRRDINRTN